MLPDRFEPVQSGELFLERWMSPEQLISDTESVYKVALTASAQERLQKAYERDWGDSGAGLMVRIIQSPAPENTLLCCLDTERPGDYVINNREGRGLLCIGPEIVTVFGDCCVDYGKQNDGKSGFTISQN